MSAVQGSLFQELEPERVEPPPTPTPNEFILRVEPMGKRLPKSFQKSNAAITVYPTTGRYTLVQRRLFNALNAVARNALLRAQDDFEAALDEARVLTFDASVADLRKLVGWTDSNSLAELVAALEALQGLRVIWDTADRHGVSVREHATLLGQWGLTGDGRVTWRWMPDVFRILFHPKSPYTPLDLELTRRFNSRYTLALFENTYRYKGTERKVTPWRSPQDWLLLLCGPDRYNTYKEFKRTVLKRAMGELDDTPDCPIRVRLEEQRGLRNRVEKMRFHIELKDQSSLDMSMPADVNPGLKQKLLAMGVQQRTALELLSKYDEAYLFEKIAYTERMVQVQAGTRKPILNIAGYLVQAVQDDYRDRLQQAEEKTSQKLDEMRKEKRGVTLGQRFQAQRRTALEHWYNERPESERDYLAQRFREYLGPNSTLTRRFAEQGLKSRTAATAFFQWVGKNVNVPLPAELVSLEAYAATCALEPA
jgi:hypothetical protein